LDSTEEASDHPEDVNPDDDLQDVGEQTKLAFDRALASQRSVDKELMSSVMAFVLSPDGDGDPNNKGRTAVRQDNEPSAADLEQRDSEEDSANMRQRADGDDDDPSESVAVDDTSDGDVDDDSSPGDVIFNTRSSQADPNAIPVEPQEVPAVSSAHTIPVNSDQTANMRDLPHSRIIRRGPGMLRLNHGSPQAKRGRVNRVPIRFKYLLKHDESTYEKWEVLYRCFWSSVFTPELTAPNVKPMRNKPALVPLVPAIPLNMISCDELILMSDRSEWPRDEYFPQISCSLIEKFLAHVHPFTALGLEAQATAFSYGPNGVLQYLALLPQENHVDSVTNREGGVTEFDAIKLFKPPEGSTDENDFVIRCWIHTHPHFKAFMSAVDIHQLYANACVNPNSFGIVISPKLEGLKALCVRLTRDGMDELKRLYLEAESRSPSSPDKYVISNIHRTTKKLYYQIPFTVTYDQSQVVDLRTADDVVTQLQSYISRGNADEDWIEPRPSTPQNQRNLPSVHP